MLKLNISKAISMRPRKGPRNRGTKKGISSKGGRGKSECRGSGRPPRTDGISGPEGLSGASCSLGPGPSFPRSRILCSICCRFMTGRLGDTISTTQKVNVDNNMATTTYTTTFCFRKRKGASTRLFNKKRKKNGNTLSHKIKTPFHRITSTLPDKSSKKLLTTGTISTISHTAM